VGVFKIARVNVKRRIYPDGNLQGISRVGFHLKTLRIPLILLKGMITLTKFLQNAIHIEVSLSN